MRNFDSDSGGGRRMTASVEAQVRLAVAIRDYWESNLAPLYSSADVREKERRELIELRKHLERQDVESARPIVRGWHQYHRFNGDFADSLSLGFRHLKLAELCQELLDMLPAE